MIYPSQTQSTNTRLYKKTVKKLGKYRDKFNQSNLSEAIELAIDKAEKYDQITNK